MKTPRNTISKAVESGAGAFPGLTALYGRPLSHLEGLCHTFLNYQAAKGDDDEIGIRATNLLPNVSQILSLHLLEAINARDHESIRSLADFVENWSYLKNAEDVERWQILCLKLRCDATGEKMTIAEIANYLHQRYGRKQPTQTDDGNAALRRICKKLKFPIAQDAKGRPKISKTPKA